MDARISTALPSHPKAKKLIRRTGHAGAWHLVCLFLWAAANRASGDLSGMSDEDIELAVDWTGEPGAFVAALSEVGFIDGEEGARKIHDWEEHNPWAAGAPARSESSRWAALCKRYGELGAAERMPEHAARVRAACESDAERMRVAEKRSAPLPSPSPSPKANCACTHTNKRAPCIPMPPGFGVSKRVADWAEAKGFDRLDEHLDAFKAKCAAKAYTYADWDAALMEAIRTDWAQLRGKQSATHDAGASPAAQRRLA